MAKKPFNANRFFNAIVNFGRPLPVPNMLGNFTTIDSKISQVIGTGADAWNGRFYIVVQWTINNMRLFSINSAGLVSAYSAPQLYEASPQRVRGMRITVRTRNVSRADNVGGVVHALVTTSPLKWQFDSGLLLDSAFQNQLESIVTSDPNSRSYSAHELTRTKEWTMAPAHFSAMTEYQPYSAVTPDNTDVTHVAGVTGVLATNLYTVPMQTLILRFSSDNPNLYETSAHFQDACIFPANTLGDNLSKPPPIGHHVVFGQATHDLTAENNHQAHPKNRATDTHRVWTGPPSQG